ncbi:MAG: manganese efflux pump MntP family protein [Deltaproteobacteria bacterium]|nr:manganese efflux pump MntP family protein [Deltaproteobacteria bacterium]
MIPLLALAVALSMDATAVAAARGLAATSVRVRDAATVAVLFGGAQFAMPLIGWFFGSRLGPYVAAIDHWIAFVLLSVLGAKMIYEARRAKEDAVPAPAPFAFRSLIVLAFATSIDALAAGLTLPLLGFPPLMSAAVIGGVTAVFSGAGTYVGRRAGTRLGTRLEWLGGLLLIVLGVKILVEHLAAA